MPHNYAQPNSIAIPIEYHTPLSTTTRVANQFTIQSDNTGCYLSFYEAIPPFVLGTADEIRDQLEKVACVRAECVARVFIPAARVSEFLEVIQRVPASAMGAVSEDAS